MAKSHVVRVSIKIDGDPTPLSNHDFTSMSLYQSVGDHHSFEIRLLKDVSRQMLDKKSKQWIGKSIEMGIGFQPDENINPPKVFKGIITSVGLGRKRGIAELIVKGYSPSILLEDGPISRSFSEKKLQEIVDEVAKEYKNNNEFDVDPKAFKDPSLLYTVQYKESNFKFLSRLAKRFGEWFYYDGLKLFFGKPYSSEKPIDLDFGENSLIDLDIYVRAVSYRFEMIGYDYVEHEILRENGPETFKASSLGKEILNISKESIFKNKNATSISVALNKEKKELVNLAKRMEEILVDDVMMLNGASGNPALKLGSRIKVIDKEIDENYGIYSIVKLTQTISQGGGYVNYFEAIPQEVLTPPIEDLSKLPYCETQLAKVTDIEDEKGLGRIKVKFLWQEGTEEKTPWIRVASPYTGKDKGFYIVPEVDDQVLVAFENNHPDKPYVLTGMYNGDAKPEWFEPKNRFKGFKSAGKNQWKFDDKNKSILIHAPSAIMMSAGKKITIKTGGKEDSEITLDTGEGTINIKAKKVNIEAGEVINLNSQKEITETANQNIKIKGNSKVELESMEIGVKGTASVKAEGAQVDVNGSALVNVKAALVKIN